MIEFDWHKWNVKIIQKPEELNKKIKELDIFNKPITEMKTPSFIYNFEFGIQEKEQQECLIEIDRPLIIMFEDNSQLEMRNNLLPIGFAVHNEEKDRAYLESWSYHIIAERLIAYNYGKISEIRVQNIENNLETIIKGFESMKNDLLFILSENAKQET